MEDGARDVRGREAMPSAPATVSQYDGSVKCRFGFLVAVAIFFSAQGVEGITNLKHRAEQTLTSDPCSDSRVIYFHFLLVQLCSMHGLIHILLFFLHLVKLRSVCT
jgi:hypothetical protein